MSPLTSAGGSLQRTCKICKRSLPAHQMRRCPVCHNFFCRKCGVVASGRRFCSSGCGRFDAFHEESARPAKG